MMYCGRDSDKLDAAHNVADTAQNFLELFPNIDCRAIQSAIDIVKQYPVTQEMFKKPPQGVWQRS